MIIPWSCLELCYEECQLDEEAKTETERNGQRVRQEMRWRLEADLLSSPVIITLTYFVVNVICQQVYITHRTVSSLRISLTLIRALNLVFLPHPS